MKHYLSWGLTLLVVVVLSPLGIVLAHGEPQIAVEPTVVAAGGTITVTGSEMENGEKFAITLEGTKASVSLGEATATGEPEAGFVAKVTIPRNIAPGSFTIRAATEEGEAATADLTVTAPLEAASAGPATSPATATAEAHVLDRTKPASQIIVVAAVIVLSSIGGFVLVRRRA